MLRSGCSLQKYLAIAAILLWGSRWSSADQFTFDTPARWQTWQLPSGVVQADDQGYLRLTRFRTDINAVLDAPNFTHSTKTRGEVRGGIWKANTNPDTAPRLIDGDAETYWQPAPDADLAEWEVDIDLGRPVLAREIRLTFPDQEGARPFRQFNVYVAAGPRSLPNDDVFEYKRVYSTTLPNERTQITFPLNYFRDDTTRVIDEGLQVDLDRERSYRAVQYVRVDAGEKNPDAALAEIEVIAVGDNLGLGTLERNSSFDNGLLARDPQFVFDGDMDTYTNIFTVKSLGTWRDDGAWWEVDLGTLFWIDGMFLYWQGRGEGTSGLNSTPNLGGYAFYSSDGQRTATGDIDYDLLLQEGEEIPGSDSYLTSLRRFRYLFKPRPIRYLFWHALETGGVEWKSRLLELMLFSPGYPARVVVRSDFIDLGQLKGDDRPRVIKGISWDVELPSGTKIQLRSRSGSTLEEMYAFYDAKGTPVTEERWKSIPKSIRGQVDTTIVIGADWDEWSNFYQFSSEPFKSASPRRFVQLELILSTDDSQVAPVLRSLSIEFEEALIQEARGRVLPRQVHSNQETRFTYTLWPWADASDSGFDLLRLAIPGPLDPGDVEIRIGERSIIADDILVQGDSLLLVTLPTPVVSDSVQLSFTTRVLRYATVFSLDLGHAARPGLWQLVRPAQRNANLVFLSDLPASNRLIGDLQVTPVFSPNGDGVNESAEIRFVIFKVDTPRPRVRIFDLAGRLIAELNQPGGRDVVAFTWSGRDRNGERVQPGIYLCSVDLGAEAGEHTAVRSVVVAY